MCCRPLKSGFKVFCRGLLAMMMCAGATMMVGVMILSAEEFPQVLRPILDNKVEIAHSLGSAIEHCVSRKDTDHVAFGGCIDWHSSVHGHWALVAIMRATGSERYDSLIKRNLTASNIGKELDYLKRRKGFEMPYGRAWFLRLAIDYERHYETQDLREMGNYVFYSLMQYYRSQDINLSSKSYNSASWALINMIDYVRFTADEEALDELLALIETKVDLENFECNADIEYANFMAVCSNVLMLASRLMDRDIFLSWFKKRRQFLQPAQAVRHPHGWHHYGLNFSRAWGYWTAFSMTGDVTYAKAYADHFNESYEQPDNWRGSYRGVGHWVGQFGMFALQPLFGSIKGRAE